MSSPELWDIENAELKFYNVEQVAARYGLSPWCVRNHIREGKLPATKLGRSFVMTPDDIKAWLCAARYPGRSAAA